MFYIDEEQVIHVTRGDAITFHFTASNDDGAYTFRAGDVVRFKVFEKKAVENVVLQKDFGIEEDAEYISIYLDENDTKFGELISKPTDYWYEVELNPLTEPQTLLGYDEDGAKIFKLYPEGADIEPKPIEPEDIPVVDDKLDMTSERPIQNRVVAAEVAILKAEDKKVTGKMEAMENELAKAGGIAETTTTTLAGSCAGYIRFKQIKGSAEQIINKITASDGNGNSNSIVLYMRIDAEGNVLNDLYQEEKIALHSLKAYDGTTYLEIESDGTTEIVVEYPTSKLGALVLENRQLHEVNNILRENQITKDDFTVSGGTLTLNWL